MIPLNFPFDIINALYIHEIANFLGLFMIWEVNPWPFASLLHSSVPFYLASNDLTLIQVSQVIFPSTV